LDDGGVVGCALPHHRRQLLGTLFGLLLPLLVAALVGATLTQWYRRSRAVWRRRSSRTTGGSA
jgi:hypothetical protein